VSLPATQKRDDVISEAFAGTPGQVGFRSRTSFDESPETLIKTRVPFLAWLLRIARNVAIDHLRANRMLPTETVFEADASSVTDLDQSETVLVASPRCLTSSARSSSSAMWSGSRPERSLIVSGGPRGRFTAFTIAGAELSSAS
jgi:Sigma-70 region 2